MRLRNSTASATEHTRCQARSQRRASACSWGLLIECCSCLMWIQSAQARNRSERTNPALTTEIERGRDKCTSVGLRTLSVEVPPKPSCNNWSSECSECSECNDCNECSVITLAAEAVTAEKENWYKYFMLNTTCPSELLPQQ